MSIIVRIAIAIVCLVFTVLIISLVSKKRLLLKYSLLWLALSLATLLCAVFPEPLFMFSGFLGFENPSNFIFIVAIFFFLAICLSLCIIASKQAERIKNLTQEIALLKHSGDF